MEFKKTLETEKKARKVIDKTKGELERLYEQINHDNEVINISESTMLASKNLGNTEAYKKAKAEKLDAVSDKEVATGRIEHLTNKPLISDKEYQEMTQAIIDEVKHLDLETQRKIARFTKEIKEETSELRSICEYANKVLYDIQHSLYKDKDCLVKVSSGNVLRMPNKIKKLDVMDTLAWANRFITAWEYSRFILDNKEFEEGDED